MLNKLSNAFTACAILLLMGIILFIPKICIDGASSGLLLWLYKLLPSLLPFVILLNLLCYLGVIFKLSTLIDSFTFRVFRVSGTSFLIFLLGLVAGYPTGAKLTKQLLDTDQISFEEAQKSLCFSTNCGPLFIIGTVGTLMLKNPKLGYFLTFIHVLSCILMLLFSRFYSSPSSSRQIQTSPKQTSMPFAQAFSLAVQNSMDTLVTVGGYIIFFSMILNILKHTQFFSTCVTFLSHLLSCSYDTLYYLLLGSLEFSNACALLCQNQPFSLHHLALLCALITFGGFCVFFQCTYALLGSGLKLST